MTEQATQENCELSCLKIAMTCTVIAILIAAFIMTLLLQCLFTREGAYAIHVCLVPKFKGSIKYRESHPIILWPVDGGAPPPHTHTHTHTQ